MVVRTYFFSSLYLLITGSFFMFFRKRPRREKMSVYRVCRKSGYSLSMGVFGVVMTVFLLIFPMQPAFSPLADVVPAVFCALSSVFFLLFFSEVPRSEAPFGRFSSRWMISDKITGARKIMEKSGAIARVIYFVAMLHIMLPEICFL